MNTEKNYPRYPVDLFKLQVIFLSPSTNNESSGGIIIDVVRENPFGSAFVKKGV